MFEQGHILLNYPHLIHLRTALTSSKGNSFYQIFLQTTPSDLKSYLNNKFYATAYSEPDSLAIIKLVFSSLGRKDFKLKSSKKVEINILTFLKIREREEDKRSMLIQ